MCWDSLPQSPIEEHINTLALELHQTPPKSKFRGVLPWWFSGKESACQCRRYGLNPWSRKIPHAMEHLGPCGQLLSPCSREPVLCNKRSPHNEKPEHHNYRVFSPQLEKSPHSNKDPAQPKINKIFKISRDRSKTLSS